jgi:hypothetical protein
MFTDEVKALPLIFDVLNQRIECLQVIQHLRHLMVIVPIIKDTNIKYFIEKTIKSGHFIDLKGIFQLMVERRLYLHRMAKQGIIATP